MDGESIHTVYLGLGSNLGDRETLIGQAIQLIGRRIGKVTRQSSLIETAPWGFESENRFLNGVVCCETSLTPREVLKKTQRIERDLGRKSKTPSTHLLPLAPHPYQDRPIDIDILLYDELTVDEPDLKIPHPLMRQRDFVMVPLREIMNDNNT